MIAVVHCSCTQADRVVTGGATYFQARLARGHMFEEEMVEKP